MSDFSYRAFGLKIRSNISIGNSIALSSKTEADVFVRFGEHPGDRLAHTWQPIYETPWRNRRSAKPLLAVFSDIQRQYLRFCYGNGTDFWLDREGKRVWAIWDDRLPVENAIAYFLGPIAAYLLRLRGVTCLHASAVAAGDRAIAFIGSSGMGKSTTATALALQGSAILTDDILPLHDGGESIRVSSSYPRLRLWEESVTALYGHPDALPAIAPNCEGWDKRYVDLRAENYHFQQNDLPLAAIYILKRRSNDLTEARVEHVSPGNQLLELVSNIRTEPFLDSLLPRSARSREFALLGKVTRKIPIECLQFPANISYLRGPLIN